MWAQLEGGLKASTWKMTRSQGFSVLLQPLSARTSSEDSVMASTILSFGPSFSAHQAMVSVGLSLKPANLPEKAETCSS